MNQPDRRTTIVEGPQTVSHNANEPQPAAQPAADGSFVPPAAEGLPLAALDSATQGANRLDAWAKDPHGRNFLAHALVQLARDGWLRTEPCEGFEPVPESRAVAEPEDFAVQSAADDVTEVEIDRLMAAGTPVQIVTEPPATWGAQPAADRAALRERIVAAIKASPFTELRTVDYANGPLKITVGVEDLADVLLRRLAGEQRAQAVPASTAPLAAGLPLVKGVCPACGHASLFLGQGGYVTCSIAECREPGAAAKALKQPAQDEAHPPRHSWRVETRDPLANEWAPGSHFLNRHHAVERWETANSRAPLWKDGTPVERRIVRETTTYTVEAPPSA